LRKRKGRILLDSRLVEETRNVHLKVGSVQKHNANPLMVEDQPWEPRYDNLYANIHYDPAQHLYRCWYNPTLVDPLKDKISREKQAETPYNTEGWEVGICYAVSNDGLQWTKPELGMVEFEGNKKNRLYMDSREMT
jgi:hypothetical protein